MSNDKVLKRALDAYAIKKDEYLGSNYNGDLYRNSHESCLEAALIAVGAINIAPKKDVYAATHKRIAEDPAFARELLLEAGIINKEGKLVKELGGE